MKKGKKVKNVEDVTIPVMSEEITPSNEATTTAPETASVEVKQLGRKVNPNSARQQRLAAMQAKKDSGMEVKRGRPVNGASARQARLAAMQAKAEANGGSVKRGRPANMDSARQKAIAERQAKIAAGETIKRGRPASPKVEATEVASSPSAE